MTELTWEGKYKDGKKVGPVRIQLPFQTVETVNETAQERQRTLDRLFSCQQTDWRNRLIWGDFEDSYTPLLEAVSTNVDAARISCDDAPTSTSNSPASATHA